MRYTRWQANTVFAMNEGASNIQYKTLLIQKNEWVLRTKQTDLFHHLPASDKKEKKHKLHGRSISFLSRFQGIYLSVPGHWSCRLIILSRVAECVSTCDKSSFASDLLREGSNGSPYPLGPLSDLDLEGSAVAGESLSILLPENKRVSLGRRALSSLPFFGVFGGEMVGLDASWEGRIGCESIV
jgi:hypothetical protein